VVFKKTVSMFALLLLWLVSLTSESVKGASLTFQGIDDVHGCDGLALGVFGVGDSVTDDIFQEDLQDTSGFLIDEARDTLDTTTAGQTTDCGLGDSLDVIAQNFAMTLRSTFAETLSSFTATSHVAFLLFTLLFTRRTRKLK
jgi:hypothetical protein